MKQTLLAPSYSLFGQFRTASCCLPAIASGIVSVDHGRPSKSRSSTATTIMDRANLEEGTYAIVNVAFPQWVLDTREGDGASEHGSSLSLSIAIHSIKRKSLHTHTSVRHPSRWEKLPLGHL
jgi:hypothetical protein